MSKYRNSTGPMHDSDHLLCPNGFFGDKSCLANTNPLTESFLDVTGALVCFDDYLGNVRPSDASVTCCRFHGSEFNVDTFAIEALHNFLSSLTSKATGLVRAFDEFNVCVIHKQA